MRLAVIACRVFNREISMVASQSENICEIYWIEQGFHNTPKVLTTEVQQQIDYIDQKQSGLPEHRKFDAIVLGYGLCSNGIAGLCSKTLKLVAPRCDDCIALFLGSQERYLRLFHENPGVYWYSTAWIEMADVPTEESQNNLRKSYMELYGEDNADYLLEMENTWIANYKNCIYISFSHFDSQKYRQITKEASGKFGWAYKEVYGDMSYINRLISGEWDEESFLICPIGKEISLSYDEKKIKF